jgi:hypothetical protein
MNEKRTVQTVQKSIVAFFRENLRMTSFAEMVDLLGVKSKSVVNFWIDKRIEADMLEKDDRGHLKFKKSSFAIPLVGSVQAGFSTMVKIRSRMVFGQTPPNCWLVHRTTARAESG